MQTTDFNQLARCADYLNEPSRGIDKSDSELLSSDDSFASDALQIAEISALASKQLSSSKKNIKLIPWIIAAAAAVIVAFVFISGTFNQDIAPQNTISVANGVSIASSLTEITADNGVATITWNFNATKSDTLVIYDTKGNTILKKSIAGTTATVALPTNNDKYIYSIERNSTDIIKKGTIKIR